MEELIYSSKKYRGNFLVWFQNSNSYLMLKEPAFDILNLMGKGKNDQEINSYLSNKYRIHPDSGKELIKGIKNGIISLNHSDKVKGVDFDDSYLSIDFKPFSIKYYQIGNKVIRFSYQAPWFEDFLHPLLAHLETAQVEYPSVSFDLFGLNRRIVIRRITTSKTDILGVFTDQETHLLKGAIFIQLAEAIYDVNNTFWMMTVHASALTNGRKTILFTASPGGGKTTLSALLQNEGFRLVSDDFVPVDLHGNAYFFPAALSVKEGAIDTLLPYFPKLNNKPEVEITPEKRVRYLADELNLANVNDRYPVPVVVFVEYNPGIRFRFEKLRRSDGITRFLHQTYIIPEKTCAEKFMEWALKVRYYNLTYSDNTLAIQAIKKLFSDE